MYSAYLASTLTTTPRSFSALATLVANDRHAPAPRPRRRSTARRARRHRRRVPAVAIMRQREHASRDLDRGAPGHRCLLVVVHVMPGAARVTPVGNAAQTRGRAGAPSRAAGGTRREQSGGPAEIRRVLRAKKAPWAGHRPRDAALRRRGPADRGADDARRLGGRDRGDQHDRRRVQPGPADHLGRPHAGPGRRSRRRS